MEQLFSKFSNVLVFGLLLVTLAPNLVFPAAATCPRPPGDCAEELLDATPTPSVLPLGSFGISFAVGSSNAAAHVSANASTHDTSGRTHLQIGVESTLSVTVLPLSNKSMVPNATIVVHPTSKNLYWKDANRQEAILDRVTLQESALEFRFFLAPSATPGPYTLPINVTIGNETGTGYLTFHADPPTRTENMLPWLTFLGGLILGVALLLVLGVTRRAVAKRGGPPGPR